MQNNSVVKYLLLVFTFNITLMAPPQEHRDFAYKLRLKKAISLVQVIDETSTAFLEKAAKEYCMAWNETCEVLNQQPLGIDDLKVIMDFATECITQKTCTINFIPKTANDSVARAISLLVIYMKSVAKI